MGILDALKNILSEPSINESDIIKQPKKEPVTVNNYKPPKLPKKIEKMIASGKSYSSCVKELKNSPQYSDMPSKDLKILVSTVGTKVMAENSIREMEKIHEYYKISCLSDSCPICKKASKMRYRIKDRKVGVNFPPLHDGCRCTFTIVEPKDWNRWISNYENNISERNRV